MILGVVFLFCVSWANYFMNKPPHEANGWILRIEVSFQNDTSPLFLFLFLWDFCWVGWEMTGCRCFAPKLIWSGRWSIKQTFSPCVFRFWDFESYQPGGDSRRWRVTFWTTPMAKIAPKSFLFWLHTIYIMGLTCDLWRYSHKFQDTF